jgi:hypothetical protein
MASGHVNRINRPNTWLHRPATLREDSPCQPGAVHTWHIPVIVGRIVDGRTAGALGDHALELIPARCQLPEMRRAP